MSNVQPHLIAREKWLTALESGKFIQCYGEARRLEVKEFNPDGHGHIVFQETFCAIGIGYHVMEPDANKWCNTDYSISNEYRLKPMAIPNIIQMNDSLHLTFKEIAARIRANPQSFFED